MKYQKGDKVRVTDESLVYERRGQVGTVTSCDPGSHRADFECVVMFDDGFTSIFSYGRSLELVEAAASHDAVNHPSHYTSHPKGYECWDVIEDAPNGLIFNVFKYLWRVSWGSKGNDLQDLKKARACLDREIANREKAAK